MKVQNKPFINTKGGRCMIESIISIDLFIDEKLELKKNRLSPLQPNGDEKRMCIVTGIHGDELEGQYVCYRLIKTLKANPELLTGIVDIYPALNPLGIDSISRGIPMFDMDMNRIFPGSENGAVAESIAACVLSDIQGSSMCIDVHSSNIFLREVPQVRMSETASTELLPFGQLLNVDFIWINPKEQVHHATLAHSLNNLGVPTMVVEMGVGMRITKEYGDLLVEGILAIMKHLGIWKGSPNLTKSPKVIHDRDIKLISSVYSGIFMPCSNHDTYVTEGALLGEVLDIINGEVLETINAPCDGLILSLREYPVVYTGSLLVRILGGESLE